MPLDHQHLIDHDTDRAIFEASLHIFRKSYLNLRDRAVYLKSLPLRERQELWVALAIIGRASQQVLLKCTLGHKIIAAQLQALIEATMKDFMSCGGKTASGGSVATLMKLWQGRKRRPARKQAKRPARRRRA